MIDSVNHFRNATKKAGVTIKGTKVKPCQICGNRPTLDRERGAAVKPVWFVWCGNCGFGLDYDDSPLPMLQQKTKIDAILAWNEAEVTA